MKVSAGLLVFRIRQNIPQVFLIHPGGPFWAKKDAGAWSIPKGEVDDGEEPLQAALREFQEETGFDAPDGPYLKLTPVIQSHHKKVEAWACEGDCDPANLKSNLFETEWPPKSGKIQCFPEADRAHWFTFTEAHDKILKGQIPLLEELEKILSEKPQV